MRILTALRQQWRALVHRRRLEHEIDEELRDHLEREAAARGAHGAAADEAWRTTLRDFGGVQLHKEDCRSLGAQLWDDFVADLRYAGRSLSREWTFASVTVLTLALGIGANLTIFSAVEAVLLRPLPYPAQDRLVSLRQQDTRNPAKLDDVAPANFLDWRERAASVVDVAAAEPYSRTLMTPQGPERIPAWLVSERFFEILGVPPTLGRTFVPDDFIAGRENALVIGYGTWKRQFGGETSVIGRVVRVDNQPFTIVGVMPAAFNFPPGRDIWSPKVFTDVDRRQRASAYFRTVGRLRDGVTIGAAQAQLDVVSGQLRGEYPRENATVAAAATPLDEALVGGAGRVLGLFLGAVALLLITACANVGNLFLVRIHRRRQELAVRAALGAGKGRVRRQVLTESLLLAVLGATAALAFARWAVVIVRSMAPGTLPRADQMTVSAESVVVAYALAVITAAAISMLSLTASAAVPITASATSMRGASIRRGLLQRSFVALQLAIATMLVIAAGLFVRSLVTLLGEERGFRTERVVGLTLFAWQDFPKPEQRVQFVREVVDRLQAVPGVVSAGAGSSLPLADRFGPEIATLGIADLPVAPNQEPSSQATVVSPGYFETLAIPLRQGRRFTWFDAANAKAVVIVNERLARQYWGDQSPIGRSITVRFAGPPVVREIVGIVADAKRDLARAAPPALYVPHAQAPTGSVGFVVHTTLDPAELLPSIKGAIRSISPNTALGSVATLETLLDRTVSPRRFALMMVGFFAISALLVGALGTYGVIAYATAERTKEIGIRMALGGRPRHVMAAVVGEGIRIAAVGVVVGLIVAAATSRLMQDLLYGITPVDWPTYAATAGALAAIALVACGVPAWRASRLDPLTVLRAD